MLQLVEILNLIYRPSFFSVFIVGFRFVTVTEKFSIFRNAQKEDWRVILLLVEKLNQNQIKFKVDGKTMIFAHGLEFKLEKICLTFKWNEEQRVKDFFDYGGKVKSSFNGFKYFDSMFEGMKVRCMFYGDCLDDESDDFLFRNTEPIDVDGKIIYVQTLEFYYENAEPNNEYYKMVEQWLKHKSKPIREI